MATQVRRHVSMLRMHVWWATLFLLVCSWGKTLADDLDDEDDLFGDEDSGSSSKSAKPCPPLNVPHTVASSNSTAVDSVVFLRCVKGYRKVAGSPTKMCQKDGTWMGKDPICKEITCRSPTVSKRSHFELKTRGGVYRIGATVSYRCKRHYKAVGNNTRKCLKSGKWSYLHLRCEEKKCPPPPPLKGANITDQGWTIPGKSEELIGTKLQYMCEENASFNATIECLENQQWSKVKLKCPERKCPKPPKVENAKVNLIYDKRFPFPREFYYSCDPTPRHKGLIRTANSKCLENRTWSAIDANFKCYEYTTRRGDCYGHDIKDISGSGIQFPLECFQQCNAMPECKSFLFGNRFHGRANYCFLKDSTCPQQLTYRNTVLQFYTKVNP